MIALLTFLNFKYLGHVIDNCLNDNSDIMREVKNLFMRSNPSMGLIYYAVAFDAVRCK